VIDEHIDCKETVCKCS